MRIAQICPPWLAVPPKGYGGIEWVVALLADGLVETLFGVPLQDGGIVEHQSFSMKALRIGAHISASWWLAMCPLSDGSSTYVMSTPALRMSLT